MSIRSISLVLGAALLLSVGTASAQDTTAPAVTKVVAAKEFTAKGFAVAFRLGEEARVGAELHVRKSASSNATVVVAKASKLFAKGAAKLWLQPIKRQMKLLPNKFFATLKLTATDEFGNT